MTESPFHLHGEHILVRALQPNDLRQIEAWRPFDDPSHRLWNLPRSSALSREVSFMLHSTDPSRLWFAVERLCDGRVIGNLTLRDIAFRDCARLGISFGADYVDQGYGSSALGLLLRLVFDEWQFQRLLLDVAAPNERARHVYEKFGFRHNGRHFRNIPPGESLAFLSEEPYRRFRVYFRSHLGQPQLLFYDMVLERTVWRGATLRREHTKIRARR